MGQQRMCLQMRKGSQRLSPREEGARSTRQHARPRVNSRVSWGGGGGGDLKGQGILKESRSSSMETRAPGLIKMGSRHCYIVPQRSLLPCPKQPV